MHATHRARRAYQRMLTFALVGLTSLAGCLGENDKADDSGDHGLVGDPSLAGPQENMTALAAGSAVPHEVTIDITWSTTGIQGGVAGWNPDCDPTAPLECEIYAEETMVPDDATVVNGSFLDTGRVRPSQAAGNPLYGTWVLTGSIAGCRGEGTVTIPYIAYADDAMPLAPNPNGEVFRGYEVFAAPTNSTGLVVTDAELRAEFELNPLTLAGTGNLVGTVTCV